MDYIILKSDGSLQTSSLNRYIQQGSTGVDKIFIGWADALATDAMSVLFTLPNQTTRVEIYSQTYEANYNYDGTHTSKGWIITLYSEETTYNGSVFAAVRVIRDGIVQVAYPFVLIVNETGVRPDVDSGVTIEDLDSYLVNIETLVGNAVRDNTDSQLSNTSENPVQNKVVKAALDEIIGGVYKPAGSISVSDLNSLTKDATLNGNVYNMLDAGSLVNEDGSTISVQVGDNVVFLWNEGSWYFDSLVGLVDLSDYVTLDTTQTITGTKTVNKLNFKSILGPISYIDGGQSVSGSMRFWTQNSKRVEISDYVEVSTSIYPDVAGYYSVGTSDNRFSNVWATQINAKGSNTTAVLKTNGYNGVLGLDSVNTLEYGTGAFWTNVADFDLGTSSHKWRDIYLSGDFYIGGGRLHYSSGFVFNEKIQPNGSYDLGSSSYTWKDLYLSGVFYHTNYNFYWDNGIIFKNSSNTILFYIGGNGQPWIYGDLIPAGTSGTKDLGNSTHAFKDLYLSGSIKGAATLTQAQYDALVSGGTVDADTFYFIEEE